MKLNINGKLIEIEDSVLTKALEDKKESIDITSDLIINTVKEDAELRANLTTGRDKTEHEIGRKELLKGLGLEEVNGAHKSTDSSIKAIQVFLKGNIDKAIKEANIEPGEKVTQLTKDLDAMRVNALAYETNITQLKSDNVADKNNFKKQTVLRSLIPDNVIDTELAMMALDSRVKIGFDDNGSMFGIGANGEPLKDSLMSNLPIEKVVTDFFTGMPALLKTPKGGAGGGDSSSGGAKQTTSEFIDEMREKKIYLNSTEFNTIKNERLESGALAV
ncbi:MAG: hypothetical protein COA36_16675 [Desulfotalea sp.]|nr:MAG: hypothetical protein COA36_16675 [Desulfotalea sp.]